MAQKFSDELIDNLLKDYDKPDDLLGEDGILKNLSKRLIERALAGELTDHLGYEKNASRGPSGNTRNGTSTKKVKGSFGETQIDVPRDRTGSFQPQIVKKGQRRIDGFDDKIVSLYARGLSTREIQGHLEEIYGVEVSPTFISNVTREVMAEAVAWQNRPLDPVYPVVYMDAMRVKVRCDGQIVNKAIHMVLAINMEGRKELLGMWAEKNEGAKFWLAILTQLQNRGLKDIFIACIDGLKGFPDAIQTAYPNVKIQLCIVHMVRNSLNYVTWQDRKAVAAGLKRVYTAATEELAISRLEEFATSWDAKYATISQAWLGHWENLATFFDYPEEIRRILYTTNPMEAVNRSLRKVSKTRGVFPDDDAVFKLFYLAIKNVSKKWTMAVKNWKLALNRFAIQFAERMPPF